MEKYPVIQKIYFRVLPVSLLVGRAWHVGQVEDKDLIEAAAAVPLPCPVWYVMNLAGGPAGMPQLLPWLYATARDGVCQGFLMRTRSYGLARLAERWQGVYGAREEDERFRFWVPGSGVRPATYTRTSV